MGTLSHGVQKISEKCFVNYLFSSLLSVFILIWFTSFSLFAQDDPNLHVDHLRGPRDFEAAAASTETLENAEKCLKVWIKQIQQVNPNEDVFKLVGNKFV